MAPSKVKGGGYGLFAVSFLHADYALYKYTGVPVTRQEAEQYPNAFHFDTSSNVVLDASQNICSPAKYINSKGPWLSRNNCQFELHNGCIYLVTLKCVKPGTELFAAYGPEPMAVWPEAYLGCAAKEKSAFVR